MDMNLHIPVSNFEFINDNDDHFFKVKLQAIAEGENLNRSDFDKDGMFKCKDSFKGKPLLCAFPKNKYTDEYKIGDGHNSSDIKYDSEYNEFYHSYLDPNSERMVGYIPFNSDITCELIDGKYWICMDAVILRKYNHELVKDIIEKRDGKSYRDNKRVSVEIEVLESHMREHETENYEVEVIDMFKGMGVTILFDGTQEAVVGANLKAFSESEQYKKFKSFMQYNFEEKLYIDKDEIGTGDKIIIKRNKVSDDAWGDINKSELYKKAILASNYKTLVKFIYAKVETGWEENPSEKLKHPIAQISDGEAFYNKNALSSALGYSKAEGDEDVEKKITRIMKQLNLTEEESSEEYAVEKNKDILDGEEVKEEYPDILEMEERGLDTMEKCYGLTMNQIREILYSQLSQYRYGEDDCYKYWLCDVDDEYVYVEDYEDGKTYRMKYTLNEDCKTASIDIESAEEVVRGGFVVVKQEGDEDLEENLNKTELEKEDDFKEEELEKKPEDEPEKEEMKAEEFEEEEMKAEDLEADKEADKEEEKMEKEPETENLEAEDDKEMAEKCNSDNKEFICKAGEYTIYCLDNKLYASKSDNFDEKFEVSVNMNFGVTKIVTGGVEEVDPITVPVNVSFDSNFANIVNENKELSNSLSEMSNKNEELVSKLNTYKCSELLSKFDEISFESNITVSEKSDWKARISKNEFSNEEELVEKFGGFVFKKNMENKINSYSSEVINEKVNNKKSYETLIDQYMSK